MKYMVGFKHKKKKAVATLFSVIIIALSFGFFAVAPQAFALDPPPDPTPTGGTVTIEDPTKIKTPTELIKNITSFILGIAGALAVLAIIYGGIRYIISRGDESEIKEAKQILTYAIIGLVVILLAYTIVSTVNETILK